jgi:hypothetical protein
MEVRRRPWGVGLAITATGVALALISGLAETFDLGVGGFGWKQVAGVVVGCLLALIGLFILFGPGSGGPDTWSRP